MSLEVGGSDLVLIASNCVPARLCWQISLLQVDRKKAHRHGASEEYLMYDSWLWRAFES